MPQMKKSHQGAKGTLKQHPSHPCALRNRCPVDLHQPLEDLVAVEVLGSMASMYFYVLYFYMFIFLSSATQPSFLLSYCCKN